MVLHIVRLRAKNDPLGLSERFPKNSPRPVPTNISMKTIEEANKARSLASRAVSNTLEAPDATSNPVTTDTLATNTDTVENPIIQALQCNLATLKAELYADLQLSNEAIENLDISVARLEAEVGRLKFEEERNLEILADD